MKEFVLLTFCWAKGIITVTILNFNLGVEW
jgi:hypothetical protein